MQNIFIYHIFSDKNVMVAIYFYNIVLFKSWFNPVKKEHLILGKDYVGYISALESCELETLESRRDKLCLSFAKKCIKSSKHRHLFPAAVHPYEHQLRHQEQYRVNHVRTEKYRKFAFHISRDC